MNIRLANEKDAAVLARLNRKFNKTQDTGQQVAARIKANPSVRFFLSRTISHST